MTSLSCALQELLVAHAGVPGRDDHVVHEGVRTVAHRLKQVLQHPLKSRIAVGNAHRHHLPLERSKWGAHGCAGTGLLGERHLMITMFQVNHREDPPPVLLLQHVLYEGQHIAVMLRLGVQAAVIDHEPPLTGNLLGDDEAGRAHSEWHGSSQPLWMKSRRIFSMASFLSPLRANSR